MNRRFLFRLVARPNGRRNWFRSGRVSSAGRTIRRTIDDSNKLKFFDGKNSKKKEFFRFQDETFVVNKSYRAANVDEISLDQGSFVTVLEKSFTGWWRVQ